MIQDLFEILDSVEGETENIRIAQGKYYLPKNLKNTFKQIKKETRWHKK